MFNKKSLALRIDETIVDIIRPSGARYFVSMVIGFGIITINAFFTFWLLQRGLEGRIFYALVWILGIYIILISTIFRRSNYLVVTSERIFDIHRESIFNETISALHFADLADVVMRREGLFATMFNYGVLTLHPLDGKFSFEIHMVPRPAMVQNFLFERRDRARVTRSMHEKDEVMKHFLKTLPEFSEADLTLLYEKIHGQLLRLAKTTGEIEK